MKWKIRDRVNTIIEAPGKMHQTVAMTLVIAILALFLSIAGMMRNAN